MYMMLLYTVCRKCKCNVLPVYNSMICLSVLHEYVCVSRKCLEFFKLISKLITKALIRKGIFKVVAKVLKSVQRLEP